MIRNLKTAAGAALALVSLGASWTVAAQDSGYHYISQFGSYGSGDGQFIGPPFALNFVAYDPGNEHILVEDGGNSRVEIFTAAGAYLGQFGTEGTGNGQFEGMGGIAVDRATQKIYVADGNDRIQIFSQAGTYLGQFGSKGSGNGELEEPVAIAIDPVSHNIVVAELGNDRVQIFSSSGAYLTQFGDDTFSYPCYLAIDPITRDILVADEVNNVVYVYSSNGAYIREFGSAGTGDGQFGYPSPGAIAVDAVTHNISVQDYGNNRVEVFDWNGNYLSQFGSGGTGDGQFAGPTGMDIDQATHNLVVLDRGNSRAEVFGLGSAPPDPDCGPTHVAIGIDPLTQVDGESFLFSAEASIHTPFGGTMAFTVDGTGTIACSTAMRDSGAACYHSLTLGTHTIIAQYSGDGFNPPGCSGPQTVVVVQNQGQGSTLTECTYEPNPPLQGETTQVVCHVNGTNGAHSADGTAGPTGFIHFAQGDVDVADVPILGGTAAWSTVFAGGTYSISANYSGDGDDAGSATTITPTVIVPADDIFYGAFDLLPPG